MQVATFVIAVIAMAGTVANAVWNIASWKLSGGRAKLQLKMGSLSPGGMVIGDANERTLQNMPKLAEMDLTDQVFGVEVRNTGRFPIRVQSWSVVGQESKAAFVPIGESVGPELPHTIEGGAQATWVLPLHVARAMSHAGGAVFAEDADGLEAVGAMVRLGDGSEYTTPTALKLP